MKKIKILVDIYGLDSGYENAIRGSYKFALKNSNCDIILCGKSNDIHAILKKMPKNIFIKEGKNLISHKDSPLSFRHKLESSMIIGINALKNKEANAFISAGNSGVLLAATSLILKTKTPQTRAVFCGIVPTIIKNKYILIADCGANISLTPTQFVEMAKLASKYYKKQFNATNPSCSLLNIGVEEKKGSENIQSAYKLLKGNKKINFLGNIEPRNVLKGDIDIILTDGWTGNIFIKTIEGVFKITSNYLKSMFLQNPKNMLAGLFIKKDLDRIREKFNYKNNPGGLVLGVNGLCMKLHGSSNANNVYKSLEFLFNSLIHKKHFDSDIVKTKDILKNTQIPSETLQIVKKTHFDKKHLTQKEISNLLITNEYKKIHELLRKFNIHPNKPELYVKALTHVTWSKENNIYYRDFNYERLEHTGDKTINYYVARSLDDKFPKLSQGDISKINSRIISNKNLAKIALKIGLDKYVRFGKSISNLNMVSDKIWASFFEGFIGAIKVDLGDNLESFQIIHNIVEDVIMKSAEIDNLFFKDCDYKTQLQERIKLDNKEARIFYKTINAKETAHGYVYTEGLFINNKLVLKESGNKKSEIHQLIAKKYLHILG